MERDPKDQTPFSRLQASCLEAAEREVAVHRKAQAAIDTQIQRVRALAAQDVKQDILKGDQTKDVLFWYKDDMPTGFTVITKETT